MKNLIFISSFNEFINFDHVIFARYEAGHLREAGTNDFGEAYPEKMLPSKLVIVTSELETEESSDYEGNVKGVASSSKRIVYRGEAADMIFDVMKGLAFNINIPVTN